MLHQEKLSRDVTTKTFDALMQKTLALAFFYCQHMGMARARLILINIAVFIGMLAILELTFAQVHNYKQPYLEAKRMPPETGTSRATHITFQLPPKVFKPGDTQPRVYRPRQTQVEKSDFKEAICNRTPSTFSRKHVVEKTLEGTPIFDVNYTADEFGRRVHLERKCTQQKDFFLFFGCSFTFGTGVRDGETLPAQVEVLNSSYHTYNYSQPGWGPGNILRRIQQSDLTREIDEKKGKAAYVFMIDHLRRVVGNLSLDRFGSWTDQLPYYFIDDDGTLQTRGTLRDGRGPWGYIAKFLGQSRTLRYFNVDFPNSFSEKHYLLFAKIVDEMKKNLETQFPNIEFFVIFFPESVYAENLIPYLDQKGIKSLDLSGVDLHEYNETPFIPLEGHPSAASYKFLAGLILDSLK
jgi:hypothetical protein